MKKPSGAEVPGIVGSWWFLRRMIKKSIEKTCFSVGGHATETSFFKRSMKLLHSRMHIYVV